MEKFADIIEKFSMQQLPQSEVEFKGEVPYEALMSYRDAALTHIAEHIELPGFRKGHVPKDMALKKAGEMSVLEEATELFVRDFYPELIRAKAIDAVGRPDIRIAKLAPNNPLELIITTTVYPAVKAPKDYRALAQQIPQETAEEATDEDVEKTVESIRKSRAVKGEDGTETVPELTDEFARSIGAFTDVQNLKEGVKKGIAEEKGRTARDTRRGKIIDALLEKTEVEVPPLFVESEIEKIIGRLQDDVARFNMTFEEYLKRMEKTEDELRVEYRDQAAKRAKLQLLLNEIAKLEKIEADTAEVELEMKHALEHFPEAKPHLLRAHIETVLQNEKILQTLEGTEEKTK